MQNDKKTKFLEMRGIDPRTSHMLSERSTTWATSPDEDCDDLAQTIDKTTA